MIKVCICVYILYDSIIYIYMFISNEKTMNIMIYLYLNIAKSSFILTRFYYLIYILITFSQVWIKLSLFNFFFNLLCFVFDMLTVELRTQIYIWKSHFLGLCFFKMMTAWGGRSMIQKTMLSCDICKVACRSIKSWSERMEWACAQLEQTH